VLSIRAVASALQFLLPTLINTLTGYYILPNAKGKLIVGTEGFAGTDAVLRRMKRTAQKHDEAQLIAVVFAIFN